VTHVDWSADSQYLQSNSGDYELLYCKPLVHEAPAELPDAIRIGRSDSNRIENVRIGRACPLLVVVKRLKALMALSGTVYRLASSMSDHTPVLFNVVEDWNEESVVLHISFDSSVINY